MVDCVLFDFDGTLAHTEPIYVRAYREAMLEIAGVAPEEAELHGFLNSTASEFAAMFPSPEVLEAFETRYQAIHHDAIGLFPGVASMLATLRERRIALAVISLKPRHPGELELDLCGLRDLVEFAVWGDDVPAPKPAPDAAVEALRRLGATPARALVVGDSASDAHMARGAGIRFAGALWGGASRERLVAAGAEILLEEPGEVLTLV